MTVLQMSPGDMKDAENAATEAADGARGHGSGRYLRIAGGGVPAATSGGYLSELSASWDDEVDTWAKNTDAFGTRIAATSTDTQGTDGETGGLFGGLFARAGGNR